MIDKNTTFIYSLIDPITNDVRYVGKSDDPWKRLFIGNKAHVNDKSHTYKAHWVQSLVRRNIAPTLVILEQCKKEEWQKREVDCIAFYRKIGAKLTNTTDGGDGISKGMKINNKTPESYAKLSEAVKKNWQNPEIRQKMIEGIKKGQRTPEARKNIEAAGKARKGLKKTKEVIEKQSKSMKETSQKKSSQQRSDIIKKGWETRHKKGNDCWSETRKTPTTEELSAAIKNGINKNTTRQQRSDNAKKRCNERTPEQRSILAKKSWETRRRQGNTSWSEQKRKKLTHEKMSDTAKKTWERRRKDGTQGWSDKRKRLTPEQYSDMIQKGWETRRNKQGLKT